MTGKQRYWDELGNPRTLRSNLRGLDKRLRAVRIFLIYRLRMQPACEHARTQVLARRDGVDYVECLDCRQIFEAEDLEPVKTEEDEE